MKKHNFKAKSRTELEQVRLPSAGIPKGVARCYPLRPDLTAQLYMSPISKKRLDTAQRNLNRPFKQMC
jgi:hypothetical protein